MGLNVQERLENKQTVRRCQQCGRTIEGRQRRFCGDAHRIIWFNSHRTKAQQGVYSFQTEDHLDWLASTEAERLAHTVFDKEKGIGAIPPNLLVAYPELNNA